MARLPNSGSDNGIWGDILNEYLQVAHDNSGALKAGTVSSAAIQDNSVTNAKLSTGSGSDGQVLTKNSAASGGLQWTAIPSAPVTSVAAKTGDVTLVEGDIANLTTDLSQRITTLNGGGETYFDAGNSGAAIALNLGNGNVQKLTLTANCTITLTSPAAGAMRSLTLLVFQDATGSRTVTWPGSVKWGNAGAPVLTTTSGRMDIISLFTVDGGTNWYGALGAKGF